MYLIYGIFSLCVSSIATHQTCEIESLCQNSENQQTTILELTNNQQQIKNIINKNENEIIKTQQDVKKLSEHMKLTKQLFSPVKVKAKKRERSFRKRSADPSYDKIKKVVDEELGVFMNTVVANFEEIFRNLNAGMEQLDARMTSINELVESQEQRIERLSNPANCCNGDSDGNNNARIEKLEKDLETRIQDILRTQLQLVWKVEDLARKTPGDGVTSRGNEIDYGREIELNEPDTQRFMKELNRSIDDTKQQCNNLERRVYNLENVQNTIRDAGYVGQGRSLNRGAGPSHLTEEVRAIAAQQSSIIERLAQCRCDASERFNPADSSPNPDINKRITYLESQIKALSSGGQNPPSSGGGGMFKSLLIQPLTLRLKTFAVDLRNLQGRVQHVEQFSLNEDKFNLVNNLYNNRERITHLFQNVPIRIRPAAPDETQSRPPPPVETEIQPRYS